MSEEFGVLYVLVRVKSRSELKSGYNGGSYHESEVVLTLSGLPEAYGLKTQSGFSKTNPSGLHLVSYTLKLSKGPLDTDDPVPGVNIFITEWVVFQRVRSLSLINNGGDNKWRVCE